MQGTAGFFPFGVWGDRDAAPNTTPLLNLPPYWEEGGKGDVAPTTTPLFPFGRKGGQGWDPHHCPTAKPCQPPLPAPAPQSNNSQAFWPNAGYF